MLCAVNGTKGQAINVEELLKDFWATRPRRPKQGRLIAGVATGIARRYAVDPVLVRVLLVVSAIYGGAGVLLYLAGWLVLAEEDDEVSPAESVLGRGSSSSSRGFTVVLAVLGAVAISYLFNNPFGGFSGFFGLLALLAGLVVLHNGRAHLGTPGAPTTPRNSTTAGGAMTSSSQTLSPDWDPLGAAPGGWDLPDPFDSKPAPATSATEPLAPPPPPPPAPPLQPTGPGHHSHVTGVTFGLALVTGAVLAAVSTVTPWLTPGHIVGIVAGVFGLGMVVGAFTRGGRGLIAPTIVSALAAFVLTSAPSHGGAGVGSINETPTGNVASAYTVSVGDVRLDLTKVPLSKDKPITTSVNVDVGDARVVVPHDADVELTCGVRLGSARCLDFHKNGSNVSRQLTSKADSGQSAGTIRLTVNNGLGDVVVSRG
ncbi:hypothetical protein KALB_8140 [Kutzneria albida DSM 43870]|uniref:Phage shock protein PspC N-terminal domain-containing protein n=1 Tax=Kutzneria albida DSM 43870 TaxID=1449976 RepID=W5WKV3_9PSEU|nr:hypothetical protein KALB_8140 [Kutzneria albida DSM 43870]